LQDETNRSGAGPILKLLMAHCSKPRKTDAFSTKDAHFMMHQKIREGAGLQGRAYMIDSKNT
jgi:hypothetical protein